MKFDPFLSKAVHIAKKRKYKEALKLLYPEEDRYYGSFKYYYLLAVICLHSGNHVEALLNYRQAEKIKMNDNSVKLGLAVLYLKRMETAKAVDYYLDVKESEPKNKIAKKALSIIRKYSSSDILSEWLESERITKLYPPVPSPSLNAKSVVFFAFLFTMLLVLTFGILIKFKVLPNPVKKQGTRPTAEFVLSRQEKNEPVQIAGSWMYILTRDQAANLYEKALSFFSVYRDEAAKININKILESNASESIKNKSRLLLEYMEPPGFNSFRHNDNPSYAEIKNEPALYKNVYVIWRGMAVNIEVTEEYTSFDFLVGYDTRRTLEGIVKVLFNDPVSINNERPLEVLGKIKIDSAYTDISIEGVAIHQSGRLESN
jgi:tetratricopeptide (TPR) repeat protein